MPSPPPIEAYAELVREVVCLALAKGTSGYDLDETAKDLFESPDAQQMKRAGLDVYSIVLCELLGASRAGIGSEDDDQNDDFSMRVFDDMLQHIAKRLGANVGKWLKNVEQRIDHLAEYETHTGTVALLEDIVEAMSAEVQVVSPFRHVESVVFEGKAGLGPGVYESPSIALDSDTSVVITVLDRGEGGHMFAADFKGPPKRVSIRLHWTENAPEMRDSPWYALFPDGPPVFTRDAVKPNRIDVRWR